MIFLVKTNEWLHLYSASSEEALIARIGIYNPSFEILHECEGTQKIINDVKQKMNPTDGWIPCNPKNVQKIIELMDSGLNDQIEETKAFILKRYDFIIKKIKKYTPIWLESAYNYDNWMNCQNVVTGFYNILPKIEILKTKCPDIYEKALELEQYTNNFNKAADCKRYLNSCENLQILPDTTITIKNYIKEENISVLQVTIVNDRSFNEIRLLADLDFDHL